jgi:hypothetical protein
MIVVYFNITHEMNSVIGRDSLSNTQNHKDFGYPTRPFIKVLQNTDKIISYSTTSISRDNAIPGFPILSMTRLSAL